VGAATGGAAFTKDGVHLRGLVSVHAFFRHMLTEGRLQNCRWLFAGKIPLADAVDFAPLFEEGIRRPAALVAALGEPGQWVGGDAGVLFVRQPIRMDQLAAE
jgi:hypothetical protein